MPWFNGMCVRLSSLETLIDKAQMFPINLQVKNYKKLDWQYCIGCLFIIDLPRIKF